MRYFEPKVSANGMLAYVATTTLPSRFDSGLSSPGKPPKAQKIGARRHVITAAKRPVPALSEESRDLHQKIAEAGEQLGRRRLFKARRTPSSEVMSPAWATSTSGTSTRSPALSSR